MNFKTTLTGITTVTLLASGIALAGGHSPVEKREAVMKVMGGSARTIGDMLKGTTDFDAAKANETLAAMQAAITDFGTYFPEGTELAGENEVAAGPQIWADRAGFEAVLASFKASIDAGVAANPQDPATLGTVFGAIGKNCGTCHETYRVKK